MAGKKGVPKGNDPQKMRLQRHTDCLRLACRIGWLNMPIVAFAFWPQSSSRRKHAERLLADLVEKRQWFKPHKMPNRWTRCFTPTKMAEQYWDDAELDIYGDKFTSFVPGASYVHDTRAASALLFMADRIHQPALNNTQFVQHVVFDREIRASNPALKGRKLPDGILLADQQKFPRQGYWLEAENAHKTGLNKKFQIEEMIAVSMEAGKGGFWLNTPDNQISPRPTTFLAIPNDYNIDALKTSIKKLITFNDRNEEARFGFIKETHIDKDGFQFIDPIKIQAQAD